MAQLSRLVLRNVNRNGSLFQPLKTCLNKTPLASVCTIQLFHSSTVQSNTSKVPKSSIWTTFVRFGEVQTKNDIRFRCSANASDDGEFLHVTWEDGKVTRYPYVWLRDNCRCEQCYDSGMNQKLLTYKTFNANAKLNYVNKNGCNEITLHGDDDHVTVLDFTWLREKAPEMLKGTYDVEFPKVYMGSDAHSIVPVFQYDEVVDNSLKMYEWMKSIKIFGMGRMKGVPKKSNELMKFARNIAHTRQTFFGDITIIKAKSDAFFIGYTPVELSLHTDYTFGKTVPGIVLLHSIQRPEVGGESWFADGFKAAQDLRNLDEKSFELLCKGVLEFQMHGENERGNVHLKNQCPTISLNESGEVEMVSYCDYARTETIKNISTDEVPAFYRALKKFASLVYSPENLMMLNLEEGEILASDNFRMLHGRAGFTLGKNGGRHVEHIFFDMEDFDSRMRCIANEHRDKIMEL